MKFTAVLNNKENFINAIKDRLNTVAYSKVDEMKKNIAMDFLKSKGEDDES
ncbi:MAG: hypothetical protein N0C84_01170 [Candidatus Thiodiazotropha taylori]|uniref:Uncharacterized protein n=1 Tax=Candidatus Thiodiazotropha taylori TaxID=2792791 RepID=A0A9E4K9J6_9GAMM|nr:hypothetical protein [Candidatus Thiodiazotropha taylori]MCW4255057.1 hypothetical protein [Candidatus Thiodiazotropha taylori]